MQLGPPCVAYLCINLHFLTFFPSWPRHILTVTGLTKAESKERRFQDAQGGYGGEK